MAEAEDVRLRGGEEDGATGRAVFPLVLLVLTLVNVLLFQQHYLGQATFPWDFIGGYHYQSVSWHLDSNWLRQSQYVPWGDGGFPAAWSLQNGSFYLPLSLLDVLRIPYTLYTATILQSLHHLWAMLGLYLLGRRLGAEWAAALFAAVIFGAGVTFFSNAQHVDIVRGTAWLPWVLWVVMPGADTPRRAKQRAVQLCARIVVLHQFAVSAYPGIVATLAPFLLLWVAVFYAPAFRRSGSSERVTARAGLAWLVVAAVVAALLLAPKFLPFIDIMLADSAGRVQARPETFSLGEVALIVSTLFGDYEGTLPHHYTMNSLWLSPFIIAVLVAAGTVSRTHRNVLAMLAAAFVYFLVDLVVGLPTPRDAISRFPITDHRALLHTLAAAALALSVGHDREGRSVLQRVLERPVPLMVGLAISVAGGVLIWTTNSPGTTSALLLVIVVLGCAMIWAAQHTAHRPAYLGALGFLVIATSYSVHADSRRSWVGPSVTAIESLYGPRFDGVPAGRRDWAERSARGPRFASEVTPGPLSQEYATAHFNGNYGLEGYNNINRSRLWSTRYTALAGDEVLNAHFRDFMLQGSQVILAEPGQDVEAVLAARAAEGCRGVALCDLRDADATQLRWNGFARDAFNFELTGPDGAGTTRPALAVINENAFPGWSLVAMGKGGETPLELIQNRTGLIATVLPPRTKSVRAEYSRAAYSLANALAALGLVLWALAVIWQLARVPNGTPADKDHDAAPLPL